MFLSLVVEHFIPPITGIGARIYLMPLVMFYGAVALPVWGMLMLAFAGGLMWDLLHAQILVAAGEPNVEIAVGWSVVLYAVLGSLMSGFRPWFQRGRWEVHCLVCGLCTGFIPLAEYCMLSIRRLPVHLVFNHDIGWRIGGSAIAATFMAPFFFFLLNYFGYLVGYDPDPKAAEDHR